MSENTQPRWGNWVIELENLYLVHDPTGYSVELKRLTTLSEVLTAIFQLPEKVWVTQEDIGNLVLALEELMLPEALFSRLGKDKKALSEEEVEQVVRTSLTLLEGKK